VPFDAVVHLLSFARSLYFSPIARRMAAISPCLDRQYPAHGSPHNDRWRLIAVCIVH
jgi:hypothetical protein